MSDPNTPNDGASNTPAAPEIPVGQPTTPYTPPQPPVGAPQPPQAPAGAPVPPYVQQGAPQAQQPFQPGAPQGPGYGYATPAPKGFAITALILGLVALVGGIFFAWIPYVGGIMTLLIGAAAVVLGILALKKAQPKGMSLTGLITGGIAVLVGIGSIILWSVLFAGASTAIEDFGTEIDQYSEQLESLESEMESGSSSTTSPESNGSGVYSAEFCATLTDISMSVASDTSGEVSEEALQMFRDLASYDSPNQAVYAEFVKFAENPLADDTSATILSDYIDAIMEDSMACL